MDYIRKDDSTNCPNCGAPITSRQCEYCGTIFRNVTDDYEILQFKIDALNKSEEIKMFYEEALTAMRRYADPRLF
jgi:hypothetical protein